MTETISVRVQHKRMTASQWQSSSLILLEGEFGVETDTGKVKVGDGRNRWSGLTYLTGPKGDQGVPGERGLPGKDGDRGLQGLQGNPGRDGVDGQRGPKGDPFTYDMFTSEQLEKLKGPKGDKGDPGEKGEPGKPFTYDMFTSDQLAKLKGPKGADGVMRFEQLTPEQKESLRGPQGLPGKNGADGKPGKDGRDGDRGPQGLPGKNGNDGQRGPQGEPGTPGRDGNSIFVRYSANADGSNMTTTPNKDTKYLGIYTGGYAPGSYSSYTWAKISGTVDSVIAPAIINWNGLAPVKLWIGPKSDYDKLTTKRSDTLYTVYEE